MILRKIKDKGIMHSSSRILNFLVSDRFLFCEVKVIVLTTAKFLNLCTKSFSFIMASSSLRLCL